MSKLRVAPHYVPSNHPPAHACCQKHLRPSDLSSGKAVVHPRRFTHGETEAQRSEVTGASFEGCAVTELKLKPKSPAPRLEEKYYRVPAPDQAVQTRSETQASHTRLWRGGLSSEAPPSLRRKASRPPPTSPLNSFAPLSSQRNVLEAQATQSRLTASPGTFFLFLKTQLLSMTLEARLGLVPVSHRSLTVPAYLPHLPSEQPLRPCTRCSHRHNRFSVP
ncbi:PREDICTED: uncharacterized protein LOC106148849 [Chinchilla lanigera]|uniref:uncharacterized protein LOC106148849 n=1 Tax=Chinchilla lanigera TaxID=34839 RepID=UPI0006980049|nr:PREDICTED: uncharacterized protein LOC106148849 [Chinchilla lanigera]XP_013371110.1 PREDICTED: uncharacterized protein LOC106148849 [Chinchilla lanigera]XP_013371111.1 PREDICTED: uncharacterized protein LOC106148849 [Chinchilla lanigera]